MEQKIIKRGYGNTAGEVTAVKLGNGAVYLFGYNPTDHSRDVKPAGRWVFDEVIGGVIWQHITPPITEDCQECNPVVWTTDQAGEQPVNWVTPSRTFEEIYKESLDKIITDPQEREWLEVSAGSGYGRRYCYYELVGSKIIDGQFIGGVLILRDEGEHDNLAGNSAAAELQGLTLQEAEAKADALNSEGSGHDYDGCHACNWSMRIYRTHNIPRWLAYQEPTKKEIIEAAIAVYNKEAGSMARLKAAIRAIE